MGPRHDSLHDFMETTGHGNCQNWNPSQNALATEAGVDSKGENAETMIITKPAFTGK